jgi:hypothetical protein
MSSVPPSYTSSPWNGNNIANLEELKKFTQNKYNKPILRVREKSILSSPPEASLPAFYSHVIQSTPEKNKKIYDTSIPGNIYSFKFHTLR